MKAKRLLIALILAACFLPFSLFAGDCVEKMSDNFIDIQEVIPDVVMDIRYYGHHNFLGERVDGYLAPKCILTKEAAYALRGVQKDLAPYSLTLKIYDCYRPQRAVNHFVRWAKEIENTKTMREFYPTIDKRNLFGDGYIDSKSGHSRGSTVDLTIVPLPIPQQQEYIPGQKLSECYLPAGQRFGDNSIDMGTGFDCFHQLSHTENSAIGHQQKINRLLLKSLMEKHGFRNYEKEWWHYTLKNEPFPNTYFNFPVE
ncbi:MAG: M15 family metallopeptidase [Smithella sp.]|nr:M15 family metallopeptidase [Smithella sp.]